MKRLFAVNILFFFLVLFRTDAVMAKTETLNSSKTVSDCAQFLFPAAAPKEAVCKIGSGQKLFFQSDVEVGQSENGPWLLCSVCGKPHNPFGFEGPIYLKTTWGGSFTTEAPIATTSGEIRKEIKKNNNLKSFVIKNWKIATLVIIVLISAVCVLLLKRRIKKDKKNKVVKSSPTSATVSVKKVI